MGELIVITGGSKCGKSAMAEAILAAAPGPRAYIATMVPFGEEARRAIQRHRAMRADKGFVTYERAANLAGLALPMGCSALLEDMGNLCANEMFQARSPRPVEAMLEGVKTLRAQTALLVIVTNQVGEDGICYPPETMAYIRNLGEVNCRLAALADRVIESVCGLPLILKGEKPLCLC